VVEAAGVVLITMLIARKLLIPGSARRAKKAPLPIPLYVYCTKIFSLSHSAKPHQERSIPYFCQHRKAYFDFRSPVSGFRNLPDGELAHPRDLNQLV
jgi:hypothetical protein